MARPADAGVSKAKQAAYATIVVGFALLCICLLAFSVSRVLGGAAASGTRRSELCHARPAWGAAADTAGAVQRDCLLSNGQTPWLAERETGVCHKMCISAPPVRLAAGD